MGRSSWGAASLVFFVLSITFAMIDWLMSLEPHWTSTMYGVWQMVGAALGASALVTVVVCLNATRKPYVDIVSPNLTKDFGNVLFMFTMLWAYTSISQYLIIWNGNLPETAAYYMRRSHLSWNAIGMVTILGQFLIPWMTLLSPRVKRYPRLLRQIAGWIFAVHIVDMYLAVAPALSGPGANHHRAVGDYILFDVLAFLTVGSIWRFVFARNIGRTQLLVSYDNRLQEALAHAH
jgi:hypothetical protein